MLKPIFISTVVTYWAFLTYVFINSLFGHLPPWVLAGIGLTSVLPFGFFVVLLVLRPAARTSTHLATITVLIVAGVAITFFAVNENILGTTSQFLAVGSLALWLVYLNWYSVIPRKQNDLVVRNLLPELDFIDDNNSPWSTKEIKGKKLLLIFYRGNWCPLCMAQIKEISSQYHELEKRGVETLLISPQPQSHTASLAEKMKVNFRFLTDTGNAMARKLGIDHKYGTPLGMQVFGYKTETVMPTVIITNEKGEIIFVDQTDNYRVRPEPSTFLEALDNQ